MSAQAESAPSPLLGRAACWPLQPFVWIHLVGSFLHVLHNAVLLDEYPGMPVSWHPILVMLSWLPIGALGLTGLVLHARRRRFGRPLIAVFATLGFAGILHFALAPFSAHAPMMVATILLESGTGFLLLAKLAIDSRISKSEPTGTLSSP